MNELPRTLAEWRRAYATGRLAPAAAAAEIWRRCEAADPAIWIHRLPLGELEARAERLSRAGPGRLPLFGVPFAIKDNIDLAGSPTTAACPAFAYRPAQSAPVVERLLAAGAMPVGKTNLDQFATGLVGVRSPHGAPRNPFHPAVIPGGSSSGSAVAVASGLAAFSLGTDTAGSGRIPAGFNGLVGWKPTRGAISTRGVVPACRSLDCVSILAPSTADAAEIAALAAAFDPGDPFSRRPPVLSPPPPPGPLRVGVPRLADLDFDGDGQARDLFAAALDRIELCGWTRVEFDYGPFRETAALLYQGPWIAERWADLGDFCRRHPEDVHPVTRGILEGGARLSAADVFAGQHRLAELARAAEREWSKMDVMLLPTAPRPYTLAEVQAEPLAHNTRLGAYTNFVNLLDLSALAVPAGFRSDGVPWGVTFIAPAWGEPRLEQAGARWESQGPAGRTVRLAVVGAHLSGLPLNGQLTERGARLRWSGRTAPRYRLYALPGTVPPRPGLVRVAEGGAAIEVEVWDMPEELLGGFVASIAPPLGIGTLELETGETVKGFLCEGWAAAGAEDITARGGWRSYLAGRR